MAQPTRKQIGEKVGLSSQRVHQLIENGTYPRKGTLAEYEAAEKSRNMGNGEQLDLTSERARLAKAQADAKEMDNAVSRGELVSKSDVIEKWRGEFSRAKSKLLAMGPKLAPLMIGVKTPAEAQKMIETVVWEALNELSKPTETE